MANTTDIESYLAVVSAGTSAITMDEEINLDLQIAEAAILGLRLVEGLSLSEFEARYRINLLDKFKPQIEELTGSGLLAIEWGYLRLTARGRLLGNEVFHRFLP